MADYAEPLCQSLSGPALDRLVEEQLLAAVEPAALEASLAAVAEVERERAALTKHWQLRLERARYESERAARQFHACEPENRLVARDLERRWEEALRAATSAWTRSSSAGNAVLRRRLSEADREAVLALAGDLPAVWRAETTTAADRQRIARLLLERIDRHRRQNE